MHKFVIYDSDSNSFSVHSSMKAVDDFVGVGIGKAVRDGGVVIRIGHYVVGYVEIPKDNRGGGPGNINNLKIGG